MTVELVTYFTCHICDHDTMILTDSDICDGCGHEQCEECEEWDEFENVEYWLELVCGDDD